MIRYLLDTNTLSSLMNDPKGAVSKRIRQVGSTTISTSIIVVAELRFGATKKASPRLWSQLEAILDEVEVEPFVPPADQHYAEIRDQLRRIGKPIGGNDMLIAAHAIALDCTLVTANVDEFSRVQGLRWENWL